MLPLQFRHPGLTFPTLLRPAGHPQNGLKFWLVDWLVGWSVGRLVGWSVGWSCGSHMNVTLPLQFRHSGPPFLTLLHTAGQPQNGLKFWLIGWSFSQSVGRSVGRLVSRSGGSHTNVTLPLLFRHSGPSFPTLLYPAGHPKNSLQFWLVGQLVGHLVGRSIRGKSHKCHSASSVLSPGPALPDPTTPCRPPPKQP
jgi:hypothetical protein